MKLTGWRLRIEKNKEGYCKEEGNTEDRRKEK